MSCACVSGHVYMPRMVSILKGGGSGIVNLILEVGGLVCHLMGMVGSTQHNKLKRLVLAFVAFRVRMACKS